MIYTEYMAISYKSGSAYIIPSDYPDLDVIRVNDTYYMVSTTMHFMPGCVILRSYNLINWEFCSYVYSELEITDKQTLKDNKGIYGKGMWAASLRYNKGIFYVSFVANDTGKTYLFTSQNIQGPWKRSEIPGFYHDMSILFDDDDRVYIVSGNTEIHIQEMKKDFSGPEENGINKIIICDDKSKANLGYEGSHIYKINGKYYIFLIHAHKGKMRTESCFVSDNIHGPYRGKDVVCSDIGGWNSGAAQGGIVQASDGNWYGILFQDHGALGRIPVLIPVTFKNDFPVFGNQNKECAEEIPETLTVPDNRPDYKYESLYASDFCSKDEPSKLLPCWQWNHIPDLNLISLKNQKLCIKTNKTVTNITQAINILTQRTYGEKCSAQVTVNAERINAGDFAGLCAFEGQYGFLAITKEENKFYLVRCEHKLNHSQWAMNVFDEEKPVITEKLELESPELIIKLDFDLSKTGQKVIMSFKETEDSEIKNIGNPFTLVYSLDHFTGVRPALFIYSTKTAGGIAEFHDFRFKV